MLQALNSVNGGVNEIVVADLRIVFVSPRIFYKTSTLSAYAFLATQNFVIST